MFRTIFLGIILGMSAVSQATVIGDLYSHDWINVGDGLLTHDRSTGLDWLDLTVTEGNSILDTESEAFFGEFRWATLNEIVGLMGTVLYPNAINNIQRPRQLNIQRNNQPENFIFSDNDTTVGNALIDLIGMTIFNVFDPGLDTELTVRKAAGNSRMAWRARGEGDVGYGTGLIVTKTLKTNHAFDKMDIQLPNLNCCISESLRIGGFGSWLVKDHPVQESLSLAEPASLALFGIGLAGLIRLRSKSGQSSMR